MLVLHGHPLSSYFQKAVIAFYDTDTPFEFAMIGNLGDPEERARLQALWPIGKMPVLEDKGRGRIVAESSIVIEYLAMHEPGARGLVPTEPEAALRTRFMDRLFDLYLQGPMQRNASHRLGAPGAGDPAIPEVVKGEIEMAYAVIARELEGRTWAAGDSFTMADCAAAPALFYTNRIVPLPDKLAAYYERLKSRPSYARTLKESEPFLEHIPF